MLQKHKTETNVLFIGKKTKDYRKCRMVENSILANTNPKKVDGVILL